MCWKSVVRVLVFNMYSTQTMDSLGSVHFHTRLQILLILYLVYSNLILKCPKNNHLVEDDPMLKLNNYIKKGLDNKANL